MGISGNGRLRDEEPMPPPNAELQPEAELRGLEESSRPHDFSPIQAPASHTSDNPRRLKEIIAGITQQPRAAINQIEQEIGSLREMMVMREQTLFEAIDEHTNLSKEAVHGLDVVRKALGQIRDAFNVAMRPTPAIHQQAEATSQRRDEP